MVCLLLCAFAALFAVLSSAFSGGEFGGSVCSSVCSSQCQRGVYNILSTIKLMYKHYFSEVYHGQVSSIVEYGAVMG